MLNERMNTRQVNRIIWGRQEHPLTIFVPWDCGHHCPFCTTKVEYETKYPAERIDYFFERQKSSVRYLLEYGFVDDVVLTGGEPLADIPRLSELIETIRGSARREYNIYINTSLNLKDDQVEEAMKFLCLGTRTGVKGISVSLPYADVRMTNARGYEMLGEFLREHKEAGSTGMVRVNSIVRGNESAEQIRQFVEDIRALNDLASLSNCPIYLRKDYTTCTQANLNDCQDPMFRTLMSMEEMLYRGSGGCLVCRNDLFWPGNGPYPALFYHRGVENTSLRYGNAMVINDIVIKQDGEIRYDWNDGAVLPKRVMDVLAGWGNHDGSEWKWKNDLFSHDLEAELSPFAANCRDAIMKRLGNGLNAKHECRNGF